MLYYQFYSNGLTGKIKVPVAFKSVSSAQRFINRYENAGGIRQFNYDCYGEQERDFCTWANCIPSQVIRGKTQADLFKYIMSEFSKGG